MFINEIGNSRKIGSMGNVKDVNRNERGSIVRE